MEDLSTEPPSDIDPYDVLQLKRTASVNEVKSTYKRLALRHHPDKVAALDRESAHVKFQEIAFAYAILSDPRRRQRYDATGNTSESITDEDGFNWSEFYKARFADSVTGEKLDEFKDSYQRSEQEKADVLAAYTSAQGNMDKVFDKVILSNPLYDEDRFRTIIDEGINAGKVEPFRAFEQEPDMKKRKRKRRAAEESTEAMEYAKELGVYDVLFSPKPNGKHSEQNEYKKPRKSNKEQAKSGESELASLIQKKSSSRVDDLIAHLESKYTGKGKKTKYEEPPEELFQRNRQKHKVAADAEVEDNVEDEDIIEDFRAAGSGSELEEGIDGAGDRYTKSKSKAKATKGKKGSKAGVTRTNTGEQIATNEASTQRPPANKRRR